MTSEVVGTEGRARPDLARWFAEEAGHQLDGEVGQVEHEQRLGPTGVDEGLGHHDGAEADQDEGG